MEITENHRLIMRQFANEIEELLTGLNLRGETEENVKQYNIDKESKIEEYLQFMGEGEKSL